MSRTLRPATLAVRGGQTRTAFDETSEPLFLTQGYVYSTAQEAEAAFNGDIDRFIYSRYGNPTVHTFEERLRLMEGADACYATATGMSAVFTALAAVVKSGSRIVAARALFGSSLVIFDDIFAKWGIRTDYVDGHVLSQWEEALATPADVVFLKHHPTPCKTSSTSQPWHVLPTMRAPSSLSTTSLPPLSCNAPLNSGLTWSCTPRPSTLTGKAVSSAAQSLALPTTFLGQYKQ